ncbi:MAG: hypothetical protein E2O80_02040 [Betaproteobacteria bacterium]|nr:MAG: hypothetical protein E2O80_02040 [Betaproteobacteria bacterium]
MCKPLEITLDAYEITIMLEQISENFNRSVNIVDRLGFVVSARQNDSFRAIHTAVMTEDYNMLAEEIKLIT